MSNREKIQEVNRAQVAVCDALAAVARLHFLPIAVLDSIRGNLEEGQDTLFEAARDQYRSGGS